MTDVKEAQSWVDTRRTRLAGLIGFALETVRSAKRPFSAWSIFLVIVNLLLLVTVASAPIWRQLVSQDQQLASSDLRLIVVMAIVLALRWFVDRLQASSGKSKQEAALERREASNLGAPLHFFADNFRIDTEDITPGRKDELIRAVLKAIQAKVQLAVGASSSSYFSVTLLLFSPEGHNSGTVLIRSRSEDGLGRRVNFRVPHTNCAAYYVARSGTQVKIEDDFSGNSLFGKKGLSSDDRPPYNSILFLPLPEPISSNDSKEKSIVLGCVTVDSADKYAFWKLQPTEFPKLIRPYLILLNMLVLEECSGVEVDG